jgi:hypothetical protein
MKFKSVIVRWVLPPSVMHSLHKEHEVNTVERLCLSISIQPTDMMNASQAQCALVWNRKEICDLYNKT